MHQPDLNRERDRGRASSGAPSWQPLDGCQGRTSSLRSGRSTLTPARAPATPAPIRTTHQTTPRPQPPSTHPADRHATGHQPPRRPGRPRGQAPSPVSGLADPAPATAGRHRRQPAGSDPAP